MRIVIDTPIWSLGLKAPFLSRHDATLETATVAQNFLRETLKKNYDLLFSSHLLAEIFEELSRKGNQIPADQSERLISDLLLRQGTLYRSISQSIMARALQLSVTNHIPVWDYLIALPFEDQIERIYTIDPHFEHPSLATLAEIENPLGIWKEDFLPQRTQR
jgi:predicted nucleic acid-binding protein